MTTTARHTFSGRPWLLYLLCGSGGILAYYLMPATPQWQWLRVVTYCALSASAAPALFYGIAQHKPSARLPWLMIAASQIIYAVADTSFYIAHVLLNITIYPFVADLFYIGHYPFILTGIVLLIRHRIPRRDLPSMLDAAVLAVVAALLCWLYLIQPQVHTGMPPAATLVSLSYPVFDLALLAVAIRLVLGAGRRPQAFFLLSGNLAALVAADSLYALQQLNGSYDAGNFLDALWLAGNISLGAAGLHPTMTKLTEPARARELSLGPLRIIALTSAALVAPTILVVQHARSSEDDILVIAAACAILFLLTIARLIVVVSEQRRLAVTDVLTGLHTRRHFETHLSQAITRAGRSRRGLTLLIIDIDHFKSINDSYGHPAGDRVLVEIARRLREVRRDGDTLARYGGEEFALLATCTEETAARDIAERVRNVVARHPIAAEQDTWVPVTVSVGAAHHTDESPEQLVAVADRALYSAKAHGRDRIAMGEPLPAGTPDHTSTLSYLSTLADRVDAALSNHVHGRAVEQWTRLVCEELGCDQPTTCNAELAGRLHDIGKVVLPEELLAKPTPLTREEWEALRRHPEQGYRLIKAVPSLADIAEIVRQHHEKFDGTGYPRGLAGSAIRLEARVITVCDSWATMLSDRPYRAPLSREETLAELRRGSGTQFDPDVVAAFLALHSRGLIGEPPLLEHARPEEAHADHPPVTNAGAAVS